MLKNFSDYLSFVTMLFMAYNALHFFVLSFIVREKEDNSQSRIKLLQDYLNNEEE